MARGSRWTYDELVLALDLYCRTPFGRLHARNAEIIGLAEAIGRTPDAVAMKCCNFASLDPAERARGVRGLTGTSEADEEVFARYAHDVAALDEARTAAMARLGIPTSAEAAEPEPAATDLDRLAERLSGPAEGNDGTALRRVRRLRALFRQIVLVSYESTCAVCDLAVADLLDAAHIVPWGTDVAGRLDPANGIAMCVLHHRAFDRGLLSVAPDNRIMLAEHVRRDDAAPMHRVALLEIEGKFVRLPRRFTPPPDAFAFHRTNVFRSPSTNE
jgi:putative restriction endonuclease